METKGKRKLRKLIIFVIILIMFIKIIPMIWAYFQKDNIISDKAISEYTIFDVIKYAGNDLTQHNAEFVDEDPYEHQFLDELTNKGVSTHFCFKWDDDQSIEALKSLGIKTIRDDIDWKSIDNGNGEYDYSYTDEYINKLTQNGISIIAIFYNPGNLIGTDKKISSDEDLNKAMNFLVDFAKRYPQIKEYEIWNEPNYTYKTDEDFYWYSRLVEEASKQLKAINEDIKIISGATVGIMADTEDDVSSKTFMQNIIKNGAYKFSDAFSFHIYDDTATGTWLEYAEGYHKNITKEAGGFLKNYITEYGLPTNSKYSEEEQARRIVRFSTILDIENIDRGCLYTLRNKDSAGDKYGIIYNDNTPKQAYYSFKNYLENTNGAEFIGEINLNEGLKAYVYDKDGKPKIITWVEKSTDPVEIDYTDFVATDLYGNNIENDGKLEITLSPVYLDNVSTNYFYQAISNTAIEKYTELEEDYEAEISSVEGLQGKIDELKKYMQSIVNLDNENESIAKQKMEEHFKLGNLVLEAYKNGNLNIEYVKLSSMLDMLNDIGESFEDLVTVSSQTRNPDLQNTKTLIDTVELELKNNSDIDILYPSKIIEISKDLYEKSEYINNLEEENDIKTGLIVSYDLHSKYLAEWAKTFIDIYIDEYIENNPITINYSELNLTNKDVIATITASDIKVTNNNGKNTYTFTQNGTFTFEYIRRGRNLQIEAKVNNIDKNIPVISGVTDRQITYTSINPTISDENLDTIILKKDGQKITYSQGNNIKDKGLYELIVTDKAGNQNEIIFKIAEKPEYEYIIKDEKILDIKHETTVSQFRKNYITIEEYKIFNNNTELGENDIISTGDKLQLSVGSTYTLVVAGDINKDGKVTAYDLSMLRNYILRINKLNDLEMLAADANCDEKTVGASDYSKIREVILGIE